MRAFGGVCVHASVAVCVCEHLSSYFMWPVAGACGCVGACGLLVPGPGLWSIFWSFIHQLEIIPPKKKFFIINLRLYPPKSFLIFVMNE